MKDEIKGRPIERIEVVAAGLAVTDDGRPVVAVSEYADDTPPADGRPILAMSTALDEGQPITPVDIVAAGTMVTADGRPVFAAAGFDAAGALTSLSGDPSAGYAFYYDPINQVFRSGSTVITGPSAEMVTNGAFASDITGWSNGGSTTGSWSAGKLRATQTVNGAGGGVYQDVGAVRAGQSFRVQGSQVSSDGSHGRVRMEVSGNSLAADSGTTVIGTGSFDFVVTAPFPGTLRINLETANTGDYGNAGVYCDFDDVSITQVSLSMQLPGATYTRTGAKSELNASGSLVAFAANVPGEVPGVGYWARGAVTNNIVNSNDHTAASWQQYSSGPSLAVTANVVAGPDGVVNADRMVFGACGVGQYVVLYELVTTPTSDNTHDVWLRGDVGGEQIYVIEQIGGSNVGTLVTLTTQWQRFSRLFTGTASAYVGLGNHNNIPGQQATAACTIYVAHEQCLTGNHGTSGPIIPTAGATQALGEDVLSLVDDFTALTDVEQILYTTVNLDYLNTAALAQGLAQFDDGTDNNRVYIWYSGFTNTAHCSVRVAGAVVLDAEIAITASTETSLVLLRQAGTYRFAKVVAGVLTWAGAATAAAFPASMDTARIGGIGTAGGSPANGKILKVATKAATFANDAAIVAAVA